MPDSDDGWFAAADELTAAAPATATARRRCGRRSDDDLHVGDTTGKKGAVRGGSPPDPAAIGAFLALVGYTTDDVYITTGPLYHSGRWGS